jgi:HEPN domain-containing protein
MATLRAARWLAHALRDHARAAGLAQAGDAELAVFCHQQAAEKALKAVLVAAGEAFERTHSLDRLLVRVGRLAPGFLECPGDPERVTAYVSRFRYPDEAGEDVATAEDVAAAQLVSDWLVERAKAQLAGDVADWADRILAERPPSSLT